MRFGPKTGMMIVTLLCLSAATMFAQQNMRVPDSYKQMTIQKYSPVETGGTHRVTPPSLSKTTAAAVEVGRMWNGYTSLLRGSNQIAYDPYSNTIVTIHRVDRAHGTTGGELTLGISTDAGATWSSTPTINTGLGNESGVLTARHPNVALYNGTSTTDRAQVNLAANWGNLRSTGNGGFYEIPYLAGTFGSNYSKKKISISPPDLNSPTRIVTVPTTGKMFCVTEGIDPSTGASNGEYYLMTSVDKGVTWTIDVANPVIVTPLVDGYQIYDLPTLDVSPDGQTVALGFVGILTDANGSFQFVNNRLGYVVSTDGGATFGQPELTPLANWTFANVNFDENNGFFLPNLSMVIDATAKPHFLLTIQSDDFFPLDSTFVGEVTNNGTNWEFFGLAYINRPWFQKYVSPGQPGQPQTRFNIWNEHEWAKSYDGNKIYAKWIDPDSLFVTAPAGYPSPIAIDTVHDVWMTAKDIRSVGGARGWLDIVNVSNTPTICEKFTKLAPYVGADNRINLVYTIFAEGEFIPGRPVADADDQAEAQMFYIPNVFIDATVGVENTTTQPTDFTLEQNYPNPFNPSTSISFTLNQTGRVSLKVYDLLGKQVATVYEGTLNQGRHSMTFDASALTSGLYIYKLQSGKYSVARTMTLMK